MSQEASAASDAATSGTEQSQAAEGQEQGQSQEQSQSGRTLLTQPEEGAASDAA